MPTSDIQATLVSATDQLFLQLNMHMTPPRQMSEDVYTKNYAEARGPV